MDEQQIRVQYMEGSSAFGHCTVRRRAAGGRAHVAARRRQPVRLQFMRWDDHGWDRTGRPQLDDVRGAIDANGKITAIDYTSWLQPLTNSNNAFETTYEQAGFGTIKTGRAARTRASRRAAVRDLEPPDHEQVDPVRKRPLLKTAQFRAPGDVEATFAFEQMIDELAYAANMDPVAFRLAQMNDDRWVSALTQTAKAANWQTRVSASKVSDANVVTAIRKV